MHKLEWLRRAGMLMLDGPTDPPGGDPAPDATPEPEPNDPPEPDPAGSDALGDAGKKALNSMKSARNEARRERDAAIEERDRLKAAAEGREAEWEAERKAREAADKRYQERIFKSELKAIAATEGVKHPDILSRLIDPDKFPLDDEGNLDSGAITEAVKTAIATYDLAVQDGRRFPGSADAGVRKDATPTQLTRDDLKTMTPDQISKAKAEGRLDDLLGAK